MDGSVCLIDTHDNKVLKTFADHKKYVVTAKWHDSGLIFATGSYDNTVNIYKISNMSSPDFSDWNLLKTFYFSNNVEALLFNQVN